MNPRRGAALAALVLTPLATLLAVFAPAVASAQPGRPPAAKAGAGDKTEDMTLAVGETRTISAKDVKNYNDSGQGIIDIRLTPDGGQFVIVGKKAGTTTLLLIHYDGTQVTYEITVTQRPIPVVAKELQQLIEGSVGLRLHQVGARIFIEGGVATEGELKRIQQVAALYPGQVEALVSLGSAAADRKTLVRIDFFFINYDRTSSYNVGIGWPDNIGGTYAGTQTVQSTLSYDFAAKATTQATASVVNQPLPSLDIASSNGWAKLMHQASILTANGSEATFSSGGVKNVVVTFGINQTLQQIKFGVDMTVLPRYDPQTREIEMNLKADVLELTPPIAGTVPSQNVTKINTLINLKLGQALVLSGIRSRSVIHNVTGLPGLSEIPVLGVLFGAHTNQAEDVEGAIFIIPSVIETVPKSAVDVIKNALSQFKDYSGDVDQVESFNKTPLLPGSVGEAMNVQVVIRSDDGTERNELCPADGPISLGRHPQCVLHLDSDLVSRQHAVVEVGPSSIRVEDVSTNGTMAGDQLLRRQAIDVPYGTPIVLGNFTVYFFPLEGASRPRVNAPPAAVPPAAKSAPAKNGAARALKATTTAVPALLQGQGRKGQTVGPTIAAADKALLPAQVAAQMTPQELTAAIEARKKDVNLRRKVHRMLLEHLDLATIDAQKLDDPSMRPKVLNALRRIIEQVAPEIPPEMSRDVLIGELADEALGLGPLERFLADPSINEIMVVDPNTIYIERGGKIVLSEARFTDDERVRGVIERIVTPLGRRIDESSPLVDARLKDGSRVNAVIKPIALKGSCITIRKFSKNPLTLDNLKSYGALTDDMGLFLTRCVEAKKNIIISGGTGSGKTTLLNVLSGAIPSHERIVTIEDAAELQLKQPHVVSLETRPANLEGKGEYSIRDLVKNALRMRPDRIVVGECRGGEALDMLQAMNTGHDGSLTTTHANSPVEAIARIETLCLMAGLELPIRAIRDQIAGSVHLVVQQSRLSDGSRKITAISEVAGLNDETFEVELTPIFEYVRTGTGPGGKVIGDFRSTGYLPSFLEDFIVMGLVQRGEKYL